MQGTLCCTTRNSYDELLKRHESHILTNFTKPDRLTSKNVEIKVMDPLTETEHTTWLNTLIIKNPDPKAKKIVFFHGFGLPSATYLPFLEGLSDKFTIYAIDHLGMGCSGRPPIKYT